jgi:hypothetical protein
MKWTDALKEYAKKSGKFVVPKKGTPEYAEVRKLMDASASATAKAVEKVAEKVMPAAEEKPKPKPKRAPRAPRAKKAAAGPMDVELKEKKMEEKEKKPRRKAKLSPPQKDDAYATAPPPEVKPKRSRMAKKKALDKAAMNPGGITMADVERSANPENLFSSAVNVHEPIAPPAALAGELAPLKAAIAKVRKPRSLPKLVEPEKVASEAPFSFSAFKRRIGA